MLRLSEQCGWIFVPEAWNRDVLVSLLNWQNTQRIGIKNLQFDSNFPVKMRQIGKAIWAPEFRCWHVPYDPDTEIYTHLTHTDWAKVKSPIEDLEI